MSRVVEIVGGPRDGQQMTMEDASVLVIPEPSMSIADWINDPEPNPTNPMPSFREVRYQVMMWHGRLCAVHPGVQSL